MKFKGNKINISISVNAQRVFESFDKIRPNSISFSLFVAMAAKEYVNNHSKVACITDFTNESVSTKLPFFSAPIDVWKQSIHNLSSHDFKEMQSRMIQLRNMVQAEAERRLC